MMEPARTRFAPSPTGFLHVGGIRTALFAWLLARQTNGQFILRFEDTDKKREVDGARDHLMESLRALGLEYDEGPDIGGPHAPYVQSERLETYTSWAQKLIDNGRAYADPYSPEELQKFRDQAHKAKQPFLYRNHRPDNPPVWHPGLPLRFKCDPTAYDWHDKVMGSLSTPAEVTDDFILLKSDGYPTYNYAHIVDDATMEITHIIRGQEFLASTPNYLNLYEALGVTPPIMATMPHIMNEQGNKKLSKRDGAKDVLDYIRDGFLPDALVNFIASMGWNDGTEQEIFTREELIEKFSLDHVGRAGARFDEHRLEWMDGVFIRKLSLDELFEKTKDFWPPEAADYDENYKKQVLNLVQERLKYFKELSDLTIFFFKDLPVDPSLWQKNKQLKKCDKLELKVLLEQAKTTLEQSDFTEQDLTKQLNELLEQTAQKPGILFSLIRIATTQAPASPALAATLSVLDKETSLRRLDQMLAAL
jgi:glutamyl-tRNA synthetase